MPAPPGPAIEAEQLCQDPDRADRRWRAERFRRNRAHLLSRRFSRPLRYENPAAHHGAAAAEEFRSNRSVGRMIGVSGG